MMSNLPYVYRFLRTLSWNLYPDCQSAAETERRQTFRVKIVGQLPGTNETPPSVKMSVSGAEGTKISHYDTLEKHDIYVVRILRSLLSEMSELNLVQTQICYVT